jgi:Phosphoinositide phospholipase C, Ca2+-dependent
MTWYSRALLLLLAELPLVAISCSSNETVAPALTASVPTATIEPDAGEPAPDGGSAFSTDGAPPSNDASAAMGARLDQVAAKSVHNAYERSEPLFDQLAFHRARSIEIDIHNDKRGDPDLAQNWYVYHIDLPTLRDTSCKTFADCLEQIRAFQRAQPNHELITLLVDLKDNWRGTQSPEGLDTLLRQAFGSQLLSPADMLACKGKAAPTLRGAITECGFPKLAEVRGKIMPVLTGGTACGTNTKLAIYANGLNRAGFVAPEVDASCTLTNYTALGNILFFNTDLKGATLVPQARNAGFLTRIYGGGAGGGLDSQSDFREASMLGAHFLATDKVNHNVDPWSTTLSNNGYPFRCLGADCMLPRDETARLLRLEVRSDDIDGNRDSFAYAHVTNTSADFQITAAAAVPNSHSEPFAKACLMARAGVADNDAYFAVCRPSQEKPSRVQFRENKSGATQVREAKTPSGWPEASAPFLRLAAKGGNLRGEVSVDGKLWQVVAEGAFPSALTNVGFATSSHNPARGASFLFFEPQITQAGVNRSVTPADLSVQCIGASCTGQTLSDTFR